MSFPKRLLLMLATGMLIGWALAEIWTWAVGP